MAVISLVSPKGGVGKTTTSAVLATTLAERGAKVAIVDADPNQPIVRWSNKPNLPENITIYANGNQNNILELIAEASAANQFVVVDLEGTASLTVAYAVGVADLVIIPSQASSLDSDQATKALKVIRDHKNMTGKLVPHRVLLTRTPAAIRSTNLRQLERELEAGGIPTFKTQLVEREAFKVMFTLGGSLQRLAPKSVSGIDRAIENATALTAEVVAALKGQG
ncbi:MAG: ParA family protein [Pseudonocardiaceae bacterium]